MYVRCKKGLGGEEKGDRTSFLSRENRTIRDETHTHTHKDKDTDGSSGSKRYSVFMEFSTFECLKISEKQLHLKRYSLRFHLVLMLHNSKN